MITYLRLIKNVYRGNKGDIVIVREEFNQANLNATYPSEVISGYSQGWEILIHGEDVEEIHSHEIMRLIDEGVLNLK